MAIELLFASAVMTDWVHTPGYPQERYEENAPFFTSTNTADAAITFGFTTSVPVTHSVTGRPVDDPLPWTSPYLVLFNQSGNQPYDSMGSLPARSRIDFRNSIKLLVGTDSCSEYKNGFEEGSTTRQRRLHTGVAVDIKVIALP
jgi:hypothetical protein